MTKQLISNSKTKSIYRDENAVIKELCKGFPKAEVLSEALCNVRVETIETSDVPKVLGVSIVDGKWFITRGFVEDEASQQLMGENPDKTGEYLEQTVDLHLLILAQAYPLLSKLKKRTVRAPKSEEQLDESLYYELPIRPDGMPKHIKLCHGDSYPSSIIVGDDGEWYLVDWARASQGSANVDVARTYLLLSLEDEKTADIYMDLPCVKTDTEKRYIQGWFPIVTTAQLAYKCPEEKELLGSWTNIFDYQ